MSLAELATPADSCFKAYDIRGRVPEQLSPLLAYRLGLAFAERYAPDCVALGRDVRPSGEALAQALAQGLADGDCDVLDLGLCGSEEIYFATQQPGIDGGIMITASHNPADCNGMKLMRGGARPVSGDSGLRELEAAVRGSRARPGARATTAMPESFRGAYVRHLLRYVEGAALRPLKIAANPGNGCAGLVLQALAPYLPFEFALCRERPDGAFPHGVPNPLQPADRAATAELVRSSAADFGIAWDCDFDRCFFFDERGVFIEGYYLVGLLAETLLARHPGARIVHDPRLTWNTIERVQAAGGTPLQSRTGHAFIKERMRQEDALYGGEMSAHHYFREFGYCDNGMIPWLLIAALLSASGQPLSALVADCQRRYPVSGEINRRVSDAPALLAAAEQRFAAGAQSIEHPDGLSIAHADWRFNLRASNTEPLLRLNVETRGDAALLQARTQELLHFIGGRPE